MCNIWCDKVRILIDPDLIFYVLLACIGWFYNEFDRSKCFEDVGMVWNVAWLVGFFGGNSMWNFVVFEDEIVVIWGFLSFFNLSDNLFVVMVKGDFDGTSKWLSKRILELCRDFIQFVVGDSMGWIFKVACEWNSCPVSGSGWIKLKCKIPPLLRDKKNINLCFAHLCKW